MAIAPVPTSCQVYTPPRLAEAMVRAVGESRSGSWLEPSCGKGAFLQAIARLGVGKNEVLAIDLERRKEPADDLAETIRGVDAVKWMCETARRFDRVVGNPPFLPIRVVDKAIQAAATQVVVPGSERRISRGSNMWAAFCCISLRVLKTGGNWAFVLPAAWDYANYASILRNALPGLFEMFHVYRCHRPIFSEVQDGSVVIIATGFQRPHRTAIRVECEGIDELCDAIGGHSVGLECSGGFANPQKGRRSLRVGNTLAEYADIRLGGVTGHASYFLLTESQREHYGLPQVALRPVVTRSHHIRVPVLDHMEWEKLRDEDERIWLFRPGKNARKHPAVRQYLSLELEACGCDRQRYKIRSRKEWYITPVPRRVDGFISGMAGPGPVVCFRAMPRLTASNTLYTLRFRDGLSIMDRYSVAFALLSTPVCEQVSEKMRRYPSGLGKLEPRDISDLALPTIRPTRFAPAKYAELVGAIHAGDAASARIEADRILGLRGASRRRRES